MRAQTRLHINGCSNEALEYHCKTLGSEVRAIQMLVRVRATLHRLIRHCSFCSAKRLRVAATTAVVLGLGLGLGLAGCSNADGPSSPQLGGPSRTISDGAHPVVGVGDTVSNSHFWWLPPIAPEPKASELGTFDPTLRPTVEVVCQKTNDPAVTTCGGNVVAGPFGLGTGLTVGDSLYGVDLDVSGFATSTADGTRATTYRLEVRTPDLGSFGGPYLIGFADFQVGETGGSAKNLANPDSLIGLKDGRTLPVKFRLDRGVLAEELRQNNALAGLGLGSLCTQNCSVTVLEPDDTTKAVLYDASGTELTAMAVPPGAVSQPTTLIIGEEAAGPGGSCAPGATLLEEACYRYVLDPAQDKPYPPVSGVHDFTVPVRFGICPDPNGPDIVNGVLDSRWRLLKADLVGDQIQVRRPEEVGVSDFLTCQVQSSQPLGGRLQDLSSLFWGLDAVINPVGDTMFTVGAAGDTVRPTVQIEAVADSAGIAGDTVLLTASGGKLGPSQQKADTVVTDANGKADVLWTVGSGTDTLTATAKSALVDSAAAGSDTLDIGGVGLARPITFTATAPAGSIGFIGVATGEDYTCGLVTDGRIFCWGGNAYGQLGDGTTASSPVPVQVASNKTFVSVAAGYYGTCALASDGAAYCWGINVTGRVGDGTTTDRTSPVAVSGSHTFRSLAAGFRFECGLATDQTTYCWGENRFGGAGPGQPDYVLTPQAVTTGLASISTGTYHACGLADGSAECWGDNTLGAFGNDTLVNVPSPPVFAPPVVAFTSISLTSLSAGGYYSCGVRTDGVAVCSGTNKSGQLGNGTTTGTKTPTAVSGSLTFTVVKAGSGDTFGLHTCGITVNHAGYCWGSNSDGQLGATSTETCAYLDPPGDNGTLGPWPCSTRPLLIAGGLSWLALSPYDGEGGGFSHTCGVTTDHRLYCWGGNLRGQLGDGTLTDRTTPVEVKLP